MSFGYLAKRGYYESAEGLAQPGRMAQMGVTSVALMASVMQDSYSSTTLYQDFEFTPSDHELERIIDLFHQHGISVMLKPMVECHDSAWRGCISFPDNNQQIEGRRTDYWDPWFASLGRSIAHYGRLAQRTGCESYCLGCELFVAEQPAHDHRWAPIVAEARSVYGGMLCYDAMPQTLELPEIPAWFRTLDAICVSYYLSAADRPGATVEEMAARLKPTVAPLRRIAEKVGVPVIFGETGCRSVEGGAIVPAEYRTSGRYDADEQANYAEALCRLFWPEPWWGGLYWWKWDEQQDRPHFRQDPAGNTGWTVQGKPAEQVLKKWFHRADRQAGPPTVRPGHGS
jgi:hypothetical protein